MSDEEIKNEFISCIDGSHTLNLAISILEDRERLQNIIKEAREYIEEHSYNYRIGGIAKVNGKELLDILDKEKNNE